jgi:ADP-ribose pyrophosphatase YjhB (NUDIX family)
MLHAHCSYCGVHFADGQAWPRTCAACGSVSYLNPLPVAVAVVPVDDGVLLVRRGIAPVGKVALPGGFIDRGETWQEAVARELREETAIVIDPTTVREHRVLSASAGFLLVFGLVPALRAADLPPFVVSDEATERLVVTAVPADMAFPAHERVLREYLAERAAMTERDRIRHARAVLRAQFGALFDRVSAALYRADPAHINFRTNTDEYEPEVGTILPRLASCATAADVAHVVHEELTRWFDADMAGPASRYDLLGAEIWQLWCEHRAGR